MLLIPDEVQREVYQRGLAADLRPGHVLCFAHGYNIHYKLIDPPAEVDVVLLAPRMIGAIVRDAFTRGNGVPAYIAVGRDHSGRARDVVLALAKAIGSTRAGVVEMTFEAETVLDLFLEQTLLPIFTKSMLWAFEILTDAGFDPGVVTLEMYGSGEMAEVFQACAQVGFYEQLFQYHSRTAQYGELSRKEYILPASVRARQCSRAWRRFAPASSRRNGNSEEREGFPRFNALRSAARSHPINAGGAGHRRARCSSAPLFSARRLRARPARGRARRCASPAHPGRGRSCRSRT